MNRMKPGFPDLATETIVSKDSQYPRRLVDYFGDAAPRLTALGNAGMLFGRILAFISSVKCPGGLIAKSLDFANALCGSDWIVASGFNSPVEKECLRIFLRAKRPVIYAPPRGLGKYRFPASHLTAILEGRMLVITPFAPNVYRGNERLAQLRNEFVCALAGRALIAYASQGGKSESLATKLTVKGVKVYTFDSPANQALISTGASAVDGEGVIFS